MRGHARLPSQVHKAWLHDGTAVAVKVGACIPLFYFRFVCALFHQACMDVLFEKHQRPGAWEWPCS